VIAKARKHQYRRMLWLTRSFIADSTLSLHYCERQYQLIQEEQARRKPPYLNYEAWRTPHHRTASDRLCRVIGAHSPLLIEDSLTMRELVSKNQMLQQKYSSLIHLLASFDSPLLTTPLLPQNP
jgi:hypothetical protein